MKNQLKTVVFLAALFAVFIAAGILLAGRHGAFAGFGLAAAFALAAYLFSDKILLSIHRAQEVRPSDSLGLHEMVARLAQRAGLPTPSIYILPDHSPNAFSTGRNPHRSAIAVTQGLLGLLTYEELESVLAHELAHIKNRDTLIGAIAATLATAILFSVSSVRWGGLFGAPSKNRTQSGSLREKSWKRAVQLLLVTVLAPFAALVIRFAVSRSREFSADERGASLCGSPESLASALRKIQTSSMRLPVSEGGPATAHLYIVNPYSSTGVLNLFGTHPPIEDRIEKLLDMQRG